MPQLKSKTSNYSKIKLYGKRLIVRPYKFSDFNECRSSHEQRHKITNKFDVPLSVGRDPKYEKFKARVTKYRKYGKERSHFVFGVFDKRTGHHSGKIDLSVVNSQLCWGNIGYHIQNQYFGNGYATEASKLILKAAFKFFYFHRIEAAIETENRASQKVAINIGLEFEGIRKKFLPDNGGIDMKVYATNKFDYK
jgi:RimJ/RimL family protein N-acetyltransferase